MENDGDNTQSYVPLSKGEEERFQGLMEKSILVDLHEHPVLWPDWRFKA